MPTFAGRFCDGRDHLRRARWPRGRCRERRGLRARIATQSRDGVQELHAVTKGGDTKLLQVLVRQAWENRLVYIIVAENRLVLPEAQAPQPDHNVHDGAHNQWWRTSSAGEARVSSERWGSQGSAKPAE